MTRDLASTLFSCHCRKQISLALPPPLQLSNFRSKPSIFPSVHDSRRLAPVTQIRLQRELFCAVLGIYPFRTSSVACRSTVEVRVLTFWIIWRLKPLMAALPVGFWLRVYSVGFALVYFPKLQPSRGAMNIYTNSTVAKKRKSLA